MCRYGQFVLAVMVTLGAFNFCSAWAVEKKQAGESQSPSQEEEARLQAKLNRLELDKFCLQISQAYHHWQSGYSASARQVLEETDPRFRGWAYDHLAHRFGQEVLSIPALEQHVDGSRRGVRHVEFSPDGKQLAVACDDLRIKVYDANNGVKRLEFRRETETIDYTPSGKMIFGGSSGLVIGNDAGTGQRSRMFSLRSAVAGIPLRFECSSDGKYVAASDGRRGVRVWNLQTGKCDHHFEDVASVFCLTPDATRLAVVHAWFDVDLGRRQMEIVLRDLDTGAIRVAGAYWTGQRGLLSPG